jgi:hypothetical protein
MWHRAVVLTAGVLGLGIHAAVSQDWVLTSAPVANWSCIASSADGSKLAAAVADGSIYTSTNSGLTWRQTSSPTNGWNSLACSADGEKLFAANGNTASAFVYYSSDSGLTWDQTGSGQAYWRSVACSADGQKVAAVGLFEVYGSTNSGATWALLGPGSIPIGLTTTRVSSTAAGDVLAVVENTDGGPPSSVFTTLSSTWIEHPVAVSLTTYVFTAVTISSDGNRIGAAAKYDNHSLHPPLTNCAGFLYTTQIADVSGITNCTPLTNCTSVASSADGVLLVAVSGDGAIYRSTDGGNNWVPAGAPNVAWSGIASSADGSKLVAVASGGGIYTWQTRSAPALTVAADGKSLVLSWVIPSMNFQLEGSSDLSTTNWTRIAQPTLNLTNLQNQLRVPTDGDLRFYRLRAVSN